MSDRGPQQSLERSLATMTQGEARVIEALSWPTLFGQGFRVILGANSPSEAAPLGGAELQAPQRIGSNVVISGTAQSGAAEIALRIGGEDLAIRPAAPETELFENLDVIVAQRHHESPDQIADWFAHHALAHGASALLLVNRAPPGRGFAEALRPLLDLPGIERVLTVNAALPLGAANRPGVHDRAMAPRTKERRGKIDPWLAPLGETALFDAMRWRFLARAAAVVALDPVDYLLAPDDGSNAFEAVKQSHTGVMPILGEAIYPWRIRKGEEPSYFDHICRAEPAQALPSRWAVAAKRLGTAPVWLPNKIAGAPVVQDESLSYQRAMSLAFPASEVAELVNKETLVRDGPLFQAAQDAGLKPIQPPAQAKRAPKVLGQQPSGRTVVVTCMKNEGPFILEWIAYHRMIGVDDFLVYTNDCDDGTVELLELLAARGIVQRRDNPFREVGGKPQQSALDAASREEMVQRAGWLISMDVDEFINVHVGAGRLPDLYAAVGEASLISMTWRLFGNDDIAAYEDRPVTEQFTRCAPKLIRRPHQAWGFKTLFRNQGLFKGLGVHRPKGHTGTPALWVNGSGKAMPDRLFKTGWRSDIGTYGYDLVSLNHYSVRSVESFLVKRDRGRVNHVARDQGEAYWFRMNNNDEQDLSIQMHAHGLRDAMASLLADPELRGAHDRCVAAHRGKIDALLLDPDFEALYDRLTSARMRKLSRMLRHFGMNVFLNGPSVIPDTVFDPNLPPNFLFNVAPPTGKAAE